MIPDPITTPIAGMVALVPTLELVRRHARARRDQLLAAHGGWCDEAIQRGYTASETSLTLLLEHVLRPLLEPRASQVNVTEQLQFAIRVLATLLDAVTPPDQAAPQISVVSGRRCRVTDDLAVALVQATLAAIQGALLDDALFLVVTLPHVADDGFVRVAVESDTPGLGAATDEAQTLRAQVSASLAPFGGRLTCIAQLASTTVTLALPDAPHQGERHATA
jgi:hypothetical protein